ncbi:MULTISPECIES: MBL fold metallo-hydrolase [Chryseobacterium]|uniref:Hydroxyacylglutathione hydrolase n=1 Tax=Chryseobacterium camelliae TaxID=1265445 RepID=A0ABU0TM04_9FLAO|nr:MULTISPECIES: MBL fold metallo-hydrolase [Chryseobacterium]MDT3408071.1 hydroxyacylglutathione hydrolase [Pseudacidovorax intermedius]MDQ1098074.1 hydroxyacylglutathione hydrolase [Chryseobacterium camelliae]MDQ1102005.1 hydroxyacylglutathione hydrolase [Chryseobacterium sp. SORGH_AS_1048]MDR6085441.1 hydroxyacylglutathione hydrolase [Chryseobacterium sp. SORGH_AS_0909]MDR6129805.1 hydroxyacylglutathione hydrolase [Chryseobacterium sp. SORGH_AS_1175]
MKVEQIYTGCLAQGAYYIVSGNEAAIIDPLREVTPYLERLEKDGVTLKYIFETHFHADFVSGHLDLSKKTGAPIVYGPTAEPDFEAIIAEDNQVFNIGDITIKVLHTPGHTMESSTFLLTDETGTETAIFTGDTLFLGDVGRPDLAQKATNLTQEDLAGILYESLQNKIMPLDDSITVYPAHGAGSACGKNMQKETVDTLGNQKKTNYALNQPDKESFIREVLDGLTAPPKYFGMNVALNKNGYESIDHVMSKGLNPIDPADLEAIAEDTGALILDTRSQGEFHKGFIPNSINIGLKGDFAPWVGNMIVDVQHPIILVVEQGSEQEAITRLSRVGFDNVLGYLQGGFEAWKNSGNEIDEIRRISPAEFAEQFSTDAKVIDVRKLTEYSAEHVENAYNKPLDNISDWAGTIDSSEHFFIHCAGGYRSMIAASILNARGIRNFTEIEGGYNGIKKTEKIPTTSFVCQSKVL